jgi:hypothetical protein
MTSTSAINTARCVAWAIVLIYVPFVLYNWLQALAIVSQQSAGSLEVVYLFILLTISLLAIGSITLLWRERAGSRLVITAIVLTVLRSPLIYSLFALDNPQNTLSTFLPGSLWYLSRAVPLIPVIMLYFCRRAEQRAKDQVIS